MWGRLPARRPGAALGRPRPPLDRHGRVPARRCPSPTTACGRSAGRSTDARVVVHGVLGCAFFGALTTKLLALRIDGAPGVGAAGARRRARRDPHRDLADVVAVVLHQRRLPGVLRDDGPALHPHRRHLRVGAAVTGALLALPPADDGDRAPRRPPRLAARRIAPAPQRSRSRSPTSPSARPRTVAAGAVVQVSNADAEAHTLTAGTEPSTPAASTRDHASRSRLRPRPGRTTSTATSIPR